MRSSGCRAQGFGEEKEEKEEGDGEEEEEEEEINTPQNPGPLTILHLLRSLPAGKPSPATVVHSPPFIPVTFPLHCVCLNCQVSLL